MASGVEGATKFLPGPERCSRRGGSGSLPKMKIDNTTKVIGGLAMLALATISIVSASSLIWGVAGALYSFGITIAIIGLGFLVAASAES